MNNQNCIDFKCVRKPTKSRLSLTRTMQTNQAAEHRNVKWSDNAWNHSDL